MQGDYNYDYMGKSMIIYDYDYDYIAELLDNLHSLKVTVYII